MEQPEGRNNVSRRRRSPAMGPETCLAEDDHQLRNPGPVSSRTITSYGTRDLSRRGRSPTVEPETCLIRDRCDMCRRRRSLGKEVEGGVGAGELWLRTPSRDGMRNSILLSNRQSAWQSSPSRLDISNTHTESAPRPRRANAEPRTKMLGATQSGQQHPNPVRWHLGSAKFPFPLTKQPQLYLQSISPNDTFIFFLALITSCIQSPLSSIIALVI